MTSARIWHSSRPSLVGARVLPMDPAEQRALDEIRRRRTTIHAAPDAPASRQSANVAGAGVGGKVKQ